MAAPEYIHFGNLDFIEEIYEKFKRDPFAVPPSWRYFFEGMESVEGGETEEKSKELKIRDLIEAYRVFGHLAAHFNPLAQTDPEPVEELSLSALNFEEWELEELFPTCGLMEQEFSKLSSIIDVLKQIYCGTVGVEYRFSQMPEMEKWLEEKIEKTRFRIALSLERKKAILEMVNKATLFEIFLHTKYVGQKRFSLEGGETLIAILQEIIEEGSNMGMDEFVIGMTHRGRLNVLTNILKKSYGMVFGEFEDHYDPAITTGKGDVKYHKGFSSNVVTKSGKNIHLTLTANPSHLESIDPVVEGKVYAKQTLRKDEEKIKVIPILIHGEAALAGQGVVYETLQLSRLKGYSTGGTIHIVVNNHIGFTTLPECARSTRYATDIAKTFSAPVFHVNAEDPEGCIVATLLALEIRQKFHIDVFIDMNCYRKYGHNEGDEPFFTQPIEYAFIRSKKSIREIYRDRLIQEGAIEKEVAEQLEEEFKKSLHDELEEFQLKKEFLTEEAFKGVWKDYKIGASTDLFEVVHTGVEKEVLKRLSSSFAKIPPDFSCHPKVEKLFQERKDAVMKEGPIDWATAELLAFASLLDEEIPVRLTGQDSRRGTFSQRHALFVDQKTGAFYYPLEHLQKGQARFEVIDSPLSEFAALGFEFGYSHSFPQALVIWEAQYGDFANGAQVMIDQYIASSEEKWQRYSGITLLLPHGYEGQGPEHSSGRLERFLQLAGNMNMQIVYPTTPSQYFHVLRRQVVRPVRKPLIIFTPKSLLRHPACTSSLDAFSKDTFEEIIDDEKIDPEKVTRVLFCTGKIYYTLMEERQKQKKEDIAIVRIEQLFPYPKELFLAILEKYKTMKEAFWVQEEPKNMGAWSYIMPMFCELIPKEIPFNYIGRARRAAPATGSHGAHVREEKQIINVAMGESK